MTTPRSSLALGNAWFAGLLLLIALFCACSGQSVEEIAEKFRIEQRLPGLAVAAVAQREDGLKTWSAGYGLANIEENVPVTADTSFLLASVTKPVLGSLIMRAQEQGSLSLESRVVDALSEGNAFTLGKNLSTMTMEHLVTHRSGIVETDDDLVCTYIVGGPNGEIEFLANLVGLENVCSDDGTLGGYLEAYLSRDGVYFDMENNFLDADPGEQYSYSNIGAGLAGYLLEIATGTTLSEYATREIFAPLGMENTSFRLSDLEEAVVATPYLFDENEDIMELPMFDSSLIVDGGLRSSANDMARFLGAMMNEGTLSLEDGGSTTVLETASVEEMLTPRYANDTAAIFWFSYPLLFEGRIRSLMGYEGGDPGVFAIMNFDQETKTGFFVAANGNNIATDYIEFDLLLELATALLARADELKQETASSATVVTTFALATAVTMVLTLLVIH